MKEKWKEVFFNPEESIERKACAVAFGVFMGIVPIWGFQMVTAIIIAKFAKLNIPLVLIAANISIPPLIPLIIYFSLIIGGNILNIDQNFIFSFDLKQEDIELRFKQYIIGSLILAVVASVFFGVLTYVCFKMGQSKSVKV